MSGERVPLGLVEEPDVPLVGLPPGRGEDGRLLTVSGPAPGPYRTSDGGGPIPGGSLPAASPRSSAPFSANASNKDVVLHTRTTRSLPASPIQPPGSAAKVRRPAGERGIFSPPRQLSDSFELPSAETSAVDLSIEEEQGEDDESLPPLRYAPPEPPELLLAKFRELHLQWSQAEELGGTELRPGEAPPTLCYVLEMQRVQLQRKTKQQVDLLKLLKEDEWEKIMEGTAREFQVTELQPGMQYAFRVTCRPKAGLARRPVEAAGASPPAVFRTTPAPPSAPTPITLGGKERKALKFKWPVPEETGGFTELTYTLELFPPPNLEAQVSQLPESFTTVYTGPETTFKVTKLAPGVQYYVRVRAENEVGPGPYSGVGQFRTAATVPSQPQAPLCYAVGPNGAYLHWLPTPCNGSPITRYQLQMLDAVDDQETWATVYNGPDCKCEILNLKAARKYTFRLVSENDVGRSLPGATLDIVTAATFPAAPSSVASSGITRNSANLMWHPPNWDGGAPVVHYEVQLFPKTPAALVGGLVADWVPVFQGMDAKCSLFGLRGGCTYRTRVRCFNAVGVSEFSMAAEFTTLPELPEPLHPPVITGAGQTSVRLTWRPPPFDGGAAISAYILEMAIEGEAELTWTPAYSGTELECEVTGLQPGHSYVFRLRCANSEGSTPWTPPVSSSTQAAPPSQPSVPLQAAITSSGISLSWEPPDDNGAPITAYALEEVRAKEDGGIMFVQLYQGAELEYEVKNLQPHQEYGFRVRAANAAGQSEWGPVAIYRTSAAPPGKPEAVEAYSQEADKVTVAWEPPLSDNGCPVSLYFVEMAAASGKSRKLGAWQQIYQGAACTCTAEGLHPGREYACRVRAANKVGEGSFCAPVHCKTLSAAPGPPGCPAFSQRTARSVKVRWEAPAQQNGCLVSTYALHMAPLGAAALAGPLGGAASEDLAWQEVYSGMESSAKVTELRAGQAYVFRATATNPVGTGPPGPAAVAETSLAPPRQMAAPVAVPEAETAGAGKGAALRVSWAPPPVAESCAAALSYEVEAVEARAEGDRPPAGEKGRQVVTTPKDCLAATVAGLAGERWYLVRVRAVGVGAVGHSPWSEAAHVQTPYVEPPAPAVVEEGGEGEEAAPAGGKKGKKARQRKGRAAAAAAVTGEGEEGRAGGRRGARSAPAKPPPRPKQPLLSRRNLNWAAEVGGYVLLVGLLVFLAMLAAKTDKVPPRAPPHQRHYLEREWEVARQQEQRWQETNAAAADPYHAMPEDDLIKLERMRLVYEEAAQYTDRGLEVPEHIIQEVQKLELSPEAYAILAQVEPAWANYAGHYQDYPDYGGPADYEPRLGARGHGYEAAAAEEHEEEDEYM